MPLARRHPNSGLVAAILAPCSNQKSVVPDDQSRAVLLKKASQSDLETAWLERLGVLPTACEAGDLYQGRGFNRVRTVARRTGAHLYVISAGLGLVSADTSVPTYGLSVSGLGRDSIQSRVIGAFDPAAWWHAISRGPYSALLNEKLDRRRDGVFVVALTIPYARLLADALARVEQSIVHRLRLIGASLTTHLPKHLHLSVMPYDDRLNGIVRGARVDFAQRAAQHFIEQCLPVLPNGDTAAHAAWVSNALSKHSKAPPVSRPRASDEAIMSVITRHLGSGRNAGTLLRVLRDEEGVACEQSRFFRLYRLAAGRRVA